MARRAVLAITKSDAYLRTSEAAVGAIKAFMKGRLSMGFEGSSVPTGVF